MQELLNRVFNSDNLYFMFFAALGVLIYYLFAARQSIIGNKPINWQLTAINVVLSMVISVGVIAARESIKDIYPITEVTSMIVGSGAIGLFRQLKKIKGFKQNAV